MAVALQSIRCDTATENWEASWDCKTMGTDTTNECSAVVWSCEDDGRDNDAEPRTFALGPCKRNVGINPIVNFQWQRRETYLGPRHDEEDAKEKNGALIMYLSIPPQTRGLVCKLHRNATESRVLFF